MYPTIMIPIDKMPITMPSKQDGRAASTLPIIEPERSINSNTKHMGENQLQLKAVWQEVIVGSIYCHEVGLESDCFYKGGTSLLLIQLQAQIKKKWLGVFTHPPDLFINSLLQSMSQLIVIQLGEFGELEKPPKIDWEWETRPAPDLRIGTAAYDVSAPADRPKSILVTGGAGFLGRALLWGAI
jgi:hybrid polyketide synthase/nonribosomal peptide synthetase ACE1